MKQGLPWQLGPLGLAIGLVLGSAGGGLASDRQATRTYSYTAPVYDDVPAPAFSAPIVREGVPTVRGRRVYRYAPVSRQPRIYGDAPAIRARRGYNDVTPALEPGFRARGTVYDYGPTYGYVAEPVETILVERENRPLGVYAPETRENLSEPRRYFRAVTRQSGGN